MKTDENEDERRWARLRSRQSWTADDAKWVLDAQAASGQRVTEFAKQRGLHLKRLYGWRARLKKRARVQTRLAQARPVALVPVTVRPTPAATMNDCAVVVSAGGVRVEVRELNAASRCWVAELLGLGGAP
jgi:hypothetical protein